MTIEDYQVLKSDPRTSGAGDDVLFLHEGTKRAAITHDGQSNFLVLPFNEGGVDNIANEIGTYSGDVLLNTPSIVTITTDGGWTSPPIDSPSKSARPCTRCRGG